MFRIEFCPRKSASAYVYLPSSLRVELWDLKDLKLFYLITNNFYLSFFTCDACVIYYYLFISLCIHKMWLRIVKETRLSAQNDISQEEVFNVSSARFCVLLGGFHWKLWSIFFIWPRIENEHLRFFVIFSVEFSIDYDLWTWCRFMLNHETNEQNCSI